MTKEEFLKDANSDEHRMLLWLALDITENSPYPVAEFGAGTGSTPFLRKYCEGANRKFLSWENNKEWSEQWQSQLIESWLEERLYGKHSVVLIDQSPGDERQHSIERLKDDAEIIVVHDAEPANENAYHLYNIWHHFKYRVFTRGEHIWTAALSNHINLNQYQNTLIGNYKIEL